MKRIIKLIGMVFLGLGLTGCKVTVESYDIVYDYSKTIKSQSNIEDNSGGYIDIDTTKFKALGEDEYLETGPYKVQVVVQMRTHVSFGDPQEIEIHKVFLTMHQKDGMSENLDWTELEWMFNSQVLKSKGNPYVLLVAVNPGQILDIEFDKLEKVTVDLEYTGIYEDGTKREYTCTLVALPKYSKRKFNPRMATFMSV